MKATLLYRIVAGIFVLFALGHTVGFLSFSAPTAEGKAVLTSMNQVHFAVGGSNFSYGGFYRGFGLSITVSTLFSAYLAWHLGWMAKRDPGAIGMLGWMFCGVQVIGLILSLLYFSWQPALLSGVVAACLGWAAVEAGRARLHS